MFGRADLAQEWGRAGFVAPRGTFRWNGLERRSGGGSLRRGALGLHCGRRQDRRGRRPWELRQRFLESGIVSVCCQGRVRGILWMRHEGRAGRLSGQAGLASWARPWLRGMARCGGLLGDLLVSQSVDFVLKILTAHDHIL